MWISSISVGIRETLISAITAAHSGDRSTLEVRLENAQPRDKLALRLLPVPCLSHQD
jgi:hypothetical protein